MKRWCQNSFSVVIVESEWVINSENTRQWSLVLRKRGCFFEAKRKGPVKMLLLVVSWKSWRCSSVGRDDVESALPNKHWTGRNQLGPLAYELGPCTGLCGTAGLGKLPSPSGPIPCVPPPSILYLSLGLRAVEIGTFILFEVGGFALGWLLLARVVISLCF